MHCSFQILTVSCATTPFYSSHSRCYLHGKLNSNLKWRSMASDAGASSFSPSFRSDSSDDKIAAGWEEVRRLRIQQRIKNTELGIINEVEENELPNFPSFIPFLPPLNSANLKQYYATCFSLMAGIMLFGGLIAPFAVFQHIRVLIYYGDHSMNFAVKLIQLWHHSPEGQLE